MTEKNEIVIEDGIKRKCPFCNAIYAIESETEILYRNVSMVYIDKSKSLVTVKCKQCKQVVEIKA